MYKKAEASFWMADEMDLSQDLHDWNNCMNDNERHFISHVLAFFAASDSIVNENLLEHFSNEVQAAKARCFYGFQSMDGERPLQDLLPSHQLVHQGPTPARVSLQCHRHNSLYQAQVLKWISNQESTFAERLVAFEAVEGIFFSGPFAYIFSMTKQGLMPGLTFSNELISRDEGMHTNFTYLLFSHLKCLPHLKVVKCIIVEAVKIEQEFLTGVFIFFPCKVSFLP